MNLGLELNKIKILLSWEGVTVNFRISLCAFARLRKLSFSVDPGEYVSFDLLSSY